LYRETSGQTSRHTYSYISICADRHNIHAQTNADTHKHTRKQTNKQAHIKTIIRTDNLTEAGEQIGGARDS